MLDLFTPASVPVLPDLTPLIQRLEVVDADDRRSIFLNGRGPILVLR